MVLCRFHQRGNCRNGSECRFSHSDEEMPGSGNVGGSKNGKDVKSGGGGRKKTACKFFAKGGCKFGSECRFAHEKKKSKAQRGVPGVENRWVGLHPLKFAILPTEIVGEDAVSDGTCCVCCQQDLAKVANTVVQTLPCGHKVHHDCSYLHFRASNRCPLGENCSEVNAPLDAQFARYLAENPPGLHPPTVQQQNVFEIIEGLIDRGHGMKMVRLVGNDMMGPPWMFCARWDSEKGEVVFKDHEGRGNEGKAELEENIRNAMVFSLVLRGYLAPPEENAILDREIEKDTQETECGQHPQGMECCENGFMKVYSYMKGPGDDFPLMKLLPLDCARSQCQDGLVPPERRVIYM
mmetsp:Transcript_12216/g.19859  ORF Transcript_12216/g.19859 Transcript_12216/m.19859 type:complete len:350 (+) Transcript_12216:1172-2221(+)